MEKRNDYEVIVVGSGLAGLSCAYELSAKGKKVLLLEKNEYSGGRTSSFNDSGMAVESGLHRYIGYYSALPRLLKKCGVKIGDIVTWEEKVDILVKYTDKKLVLGLAPLFAPVKTLKGVLGNNDLLSTKDKLSLVPFFLCGFTSYIFSQKLDDYSVTEYANFHNVTQNSKKLVLEPLSSGIFFMPPENYSAYAFFGLFAPAVSKFYKMRIGAFLGGMSEVMCAPIAEKIKSLGGELRFGEGVHSVIVENKAVTGVKTENAKEYYAPQTVIAADIESAKKILSPLKNEACLKKLFSLKTMSACTIQLELTQPSMKKDITTFAPSTDLVSFAEQSRTTFRKMKGRLSLILGNPEEYIKKSPEEMLKYTVDELKNLNIDVKDKILNYRKVSEKHKFYSLDKGNQKYRPSQHTDISGLTLAGDYTLTSSFATMEGAVKSGKQAAKECLKRLRR